MIAALELTLIIDSDSSSTSSGSSSYPTIIPGVSTKKDILRYIDVYHDEARDGLHSVYFCTAGIRAKHQIVPVSLNP